MPCASEDVAKSEPGPDISVRNRDTSSTGRPVFFKAVNREENSVYRFLPSPATELCKPLVLGYPSLSRLLMVCHVLVDVHPVPLFKAWHYIRSCRWRRDAGIGTVDLQVVQVRGISSRPSRGMWSPFDRDGSARFNKIEVACESSYEEKGLPLKAHPAQSCIAV